jgi:RimJ/RimL family protein N-acetyltransferase
VKTNNLTTARLSLRELTPAQVAVLLDPEARSDEWITGYPLPGSRNAATGFGRRGPDDLRFGFGMYHLVRTSDGLVIGDLGFHQPPADGAVEVGFALAEAARGVGYASEALGELVRWALSQPGVDEVVARTLDSNTPSQGVLTRNGFERVGRDGDFERFVARAAR